MGGISTFGLLVLISHVAIEVFFLMKAVALRALESRLTYTETMY